MAITDKTRKTLWARSGNRCAICRTELVAERNEHNKNLNIGDECHIISEQPNGPRHIPGNNSDFDDYDNLILLCKNHHRTIDELLETYTAELIISFKTNHENWIKDVIDNAKNKEKENPTKFLPRLTKGKEVVDIIKGAHGFQFDHDEFKSQKETDFVSGFFQNLQDWCDMSMFSDFEISGQIQLSYDLNKDLEDLNKLGFFLFGEQRTSLMTNASKDDLGVWKIATLLVLRHENPNIIDGNKLAAIIKPLTS
jgi:hypothetical protein